MLPVPTGCGTSQRFTVAVLRGPTSTEPRFWRARVCVLLFALFAGTHAKRFGFRDGANLVRMLLVFVALLPSFFVAECANVSTRMWWFWACGDFYSAGLCRGFSIKFIRGHFFGVLGCFVCSLW